MGQLWDALTNPATERERLAAERASRVSGQQARAMQSVGEFVQSPPVGAAKSGFVSIVDKLMRPYYATTALDREFMPEWKVAEKAVESYPPLAGALGRGVGMGPVTGALAALLASGRKDAANPAGRAMGAIGRGLAGRDKATTRELWDEVYGPTQGASESIARSASALVFDTFRDPLTPLSFFDPTTAGVKAAATGTLAPTLAGRAAAKQMALVSFGGKPLVYGAKALKPISRLAARGRNSLLGEALREMFVAPRPPAALAKVLSEYDIGKQRLRVKGYKDVMPIKAQMDELATATGRPMAEMGEDFLDVVERGPTAAANRADLVQGISRDLAESGIKEDAATVASALAGTPRTMDELIEGALTPELLGKGREAVDTWVETFSTKLAELRGSNMRIGDLGESYVPRIMTDEWFNRLDEAEKAFPTLGLKDKFFAQQERVLSKDYFIKDFNRIMREDGIVGILPDWPAEANFKVGQAIHTDPAYIAARYMTGAANATSAKNVIGDITSLPGVTYEAEAAKVPMGYVPVGVKGLEDVYAEPELAAEIQKHFPKILDAAKKDPSEVTNLFVKNFFDPAQDWWKSWTLSVFPSYHLRNVGGNAWNASALAGMTDPTRLPDFAAFQMQAWEPTSAFGQAFKEHAKKVLPKDLDAVAAKYGFESAEDLMIQAKAYNIGGRGWQAAEMGADTGPLTAVRQARLRPEAWFDPEAVAQTVTNAAEAVPEYVRLSDLPGLGWLKDKRAGRARPGIALGKQSAPIKGGRTVGTLLEDNWRGGLWLDQIERFRAAGASLDDAARAAAGQVKKYLFDYSELSDFEKKYMKRIMPFYTWTRKNLPLQVEELIRQPAKFSAIEKSRRAVEGAVGRGPNETYMQDYMTERTPMRISGGDPWAKTSYQPLENIIPAVDLGALTSPRRMVSKVVNLLTPAKAAVELPLNYSAYYGGPISDYPWERTQMFGKSLPAKAAYATRQFRPVSESAWQYQALAGDIDPTAALLRLLIGKTQVYDPIKAGDWYRWEATQEAMAAKRDAEKAKRDQRWDDYNHYIAAYEDALARSKQ